MQSKATTVHAYLAELPPDRRAAIAAVRKVILKNLDKKYGEGMSYGMIGYFVPHSVYPAGYHCNPKQPLPFAGLASQKNYMSLYMMCLYGEGTPYEARFRAAWAKSGKKLDMGKCCIRFKKVEDLALDVIGETIRKTPARAYIEQYEKLLAEYRHFNLGAGILARLHRRGPDVRPGFRPARQDRPARRVRRYLSRPGLSGDQRHLPRLLEDA